MKKTLIPTIIYHLQLFTKTSGKSATIFFIKWKLREHTIQMSDLRPIGPLVNTADWFYSMAWWLFFHQFFDSNNFTGSTESISDKCSRK